jgi:hypothetical protein
LAVLEQDYDLRDKEKIMPDLTTGSITTGAGVAGAVQVAANFQKPKAGNGLGPRTVIVKIDKTNMTDAELNASIAFLTQSSGVAGALPGNAQEAFTVAGIVSDETNGEFISGTSDTVTLALQGTGVVTNMKAGLEALAGVTTATVLAVFDQRVIPG